MTLANLLRSRLYIEHASTPGGRRLSLREQDCDLAYRRGWNAAMRMAIEIVEGRPAGIGQPFRAGDVVEVLGCPDAGERWVVAVYEASRDTAWFAGWPCTMVEQASGKLRLVLRATDEQHARMIERVRTVRTMQGDPRRCALEHVIAAGGTP